VSDLTAYLSIDAGGSSTCAVVRTGGARCWGWNVDGQLGNGTFNSSLVPVAVQSLTDVLRVGVGGLAYPDEPIPSLDYPGHACALVLGGSVRCWGDGENGSLANSATLPAPPSSIPQVALLSNAPLPGTGPTTGLSTLSVGYVSGCATSSGSTSAAEGVVRCWGSNGNGQTGTGTNLPVPVATAAVGIPI
jgi:alpha-tubulin suppressor-like RCC1 family protein